MAVFGASVPFRFVERFDVQLLRTSSSSARQGRAMTSVISVDTVSSCPILGYPKFVIFLISSFMRVVRKGSTLRMYAEALASDG